MTSSVPIADAAFRHEAAFAAAPARGLRDCVERIHQGDWTFIQLRGVPLTDAPFNDADVDLLGTEQSVQRLVSAAFSWVQQGDCHLRFVRRNGRKATLTLYSLDASLRLQLDLWVQLPQIDHGRRTLTFDGVRRLADPATSITEHPAVLTATRSTAERNSPGAGNPASSIRRLPLHDEVCLYLQHVLCKRRDVGSERVRSRLQPYMDRITQQEPAGSDGARLSAALRQVLDNGSISAELAALSQQHLGRHMTLKKTRGRRLEQLRSFWLVGLRRPSRFTAIVGCDGSGKTSLAQRLVQQHPGLMIHTVGKRLYRGSLIYKLLLAVVRPVLFLNREHFDDRLAPVNYVLASVRLRLLALCWWHPWRVFDRGLLDFLYQHRKSDTPKFSRWRFLSQMIGLRVTTVHLLVSEHVLNERRREVTAAGHRKYDDAMQNALTDRCPTDYVAFNNHADCMESAQRLMQILQRPS